MRKKPFCKLAKRSNKIHLESAHWDLRNLDGYAWKECLEPRISRFDANYNGLAIDALFDVVKSIMHDMRIVVDVSKLLVSIAQQLPTVEKEKVYFLDKKEWTPRRDYYNLRPRRGQ